MKKCPFCAEEIQDDAIKCRYCSEFLEQPKDKFKWYYKNSWIVMGFLMVGPFVLPLIWYNPRFNPKTKIIITIIVLVLSVILFKSMLATIHSLKESMTALNTLLEM